jgi:hypothetical protein
MLHTGELVPHFTVRTTDGTTIEYSAIWQRRNLVLVTLPPDERETATRYAGALSAFRSELERGEAAGVVTHDVVRDVPAPGALVADRWGEIVFITHAERVEDLPSIDELMRWLHYVQIRCAECEGEAR